MDDGNKKQEARSDWQEEPAPLTAHPFWADCGIEEKIERLREEVLLLRDLVFVPVTRLQTDFLQSFNASEPGAIRRLTPQPVRRHDPLA